MIPVSVRPAGPADVQALALVGAATFLDAYAGVLPGGDVVLHCATRHTPDAYDTLLAQGAKAWLAEAEPEGAPVAYAVLSAPDIPQAQAGDLELKRIYVLSRFHGTGLAAELFAQARGEARAQGASRLLLGAYAGNRRALRFYEKQGFVQIGTRTFTMGARVYDDDVVMALRL
jgi:GNAT superfamily N-acetyltransferase